MWGPPCWETRETPINNPIKCSSTGWWPTHVPEKNWPWNSGLKQMSWSSTGTICQRHTGHTCWKTCVALSNSSFLSVSRVRFPIAGWYHILIHSWRLESTCSGQITLEFPRNVTHFIIHIMSLILNYSIWDMILYPPVIKHGLLENQPFSSMTFQLETSSSGISPGHVGWHRVKISWHPQLNIPMIHQMSL